jgi:hypothetical protein
MVITMSGPTWFHHHVKSVLLLCPELLSLESIFCKFC